MPRLSLEQKAENKFPIDAQATASDVSDILAMRKAWMRIEERKLKQAKKDKDKANREALAFGKSLIKHYPTLTLADITQLKNDQLELEKLKHIAKLSYRNEQGAMYFRDNGTNLLFDFLDKYR